MAVDQAVVTGVVIVIIVVLFMMFLDLLSPLILQHEFKACCRPYVFMAESENGLSLNDQKRLKEALTQLGIKNIELSIAEKGTSKRMTVIPFSVKGEIHIDGFKSLFEREQRVLEIQFEATQIARRIKVFE
ncbi:hypothetical protein [Fusibacter tunisiensis]|jgi:hypothetical protein|uniref:Uncharacterized protein n=1 Tax=Fusibacter tunisiensis TaxID=1008308 RepID=A0ABS2MNK9_9FIRM|nr:hypothetical protein [Fusibacter tunisiensis]MBM7560977.1 hypothetical protein [Fusibacter tunisiensis]